MNSIERASTPAADRLRALHRTKLRSLPLSTGLIGVRPGVLPHLAEEARVLLACTMLLDPGNPEAEQWLRLFCRAYTLQAAARIPGGGPATLDLPVFGPSAMPRQDGPGLLRLRHFTDACHAALALRDVEAWSLLEKVPLDSMEDSPSPHLMLQARSLQAYLRGEIRLAAVLALDALVACNDEALPPAELDHALLVASPEIELLTCWDQPQGEWEPCILNAIGYNRRYAEIRGDGDMLPSSFVMPGALAFAAMRHAASLPASPHAPELPPGLIRRSYAGLGGNLKAGP